MGSIFQDDRIHFYRTCQKASEHALVICPSLVQALHTIPHTHINPSISTIKILLMLHGHSSTSRCAAGLEVGDSKQIWHLGLVNLFYREKVRQNPKDSHLAHRDPYLKRDKMRCRL